MSVTWHVARLIASTAALLLVLQAPPAAAYTWYLVDDGQGEPLRWFRTALAYRVAVVAPEEVPAAAVPEIVERGFDAWVDLAGCNVPEMTYAGATTVTKRTVPTALAAPPDNVIVFIRSEAAWLAEGHARTWIAITSIAHDRTTGEIVDADIEVNDGTYRFSTGGLPPDAGWIDLDSTLTHEIGHFFGLDHSLVAGATMYRTYSQTENPVGGRTLEPDDVDGMCALYDDVPPHVENRPPRDEDCAGGGGGAPLGLALAITALWGWRRRFCQPS